MSTWHLVGLVGLMLIAQAGRLAVHHKEHLKAAGVQYSLPPPEVILWLASGFIISFVACLKQTGKFLPIHLKADINREVALPDLVDFISFHHRGKAIYPTFDIKFKAK